MYNTTAKSHVQAAMDGFNSVVFAYGQTGTIAAIGSRALQLITLYSFRQDVHLGMGHSRRVMMFKVDYITDGQRR